MQRLCRFFAKGYCKLGISCPDKHVSWPCLAGSAQLAAASWDGWRRPTAQSARLEELLAMADGGMKSRHHAGICVRQLQPLLNHAQRHCHRHIVCMQVEEGEQVSRVPVVDRLKHKAGPDAVVSLTFMAAMLTGGLHSSH